MGIIAQTVLHPLLTGPLWFLLTAAPANIKEPVIQSLRQHVSAETLTRAISVLKWLTILGVGRWINNALSVLAQNNFRLRSEKHRYNWPKEVAVVTGAAGGFGRLMTLDFASRGINVVAVDIVDKLPKDMQNHPKITYYKVDITDPEAVKQLAREVSQAHGDPSILINNAGIAAKDMNIMSISPESLNRIMSVNLISHYYTVQAFMPAMIAGKKGHIVTVASMASFVSPPAMAPYNNTKAALVSFHETIQTETRLIHQAPEIKFTIVHPTFAETPLVTPYLDELKTSGLLIMPPKVVSDAIVKQVLSCTGGQIILPPVYSAVTGLRSLPHWVSQGLMRLSEMSTSKGFEAHARKMRGQD
jgi:all-trans-retinol dehydrogenase (NAD+)